MDTVKAKELERSLIGKKIDGWTIDSYVNHGKSAAVFKGHKGKELAAVKIFDDELIKRYGDDVQFTRIERELTLIGNKHPNMVEILGGGFDPITKNHYIIMEYVAGRNIAERLHEIPPDRIEVFIEQLASAAKFLETLELCHRDIKPENVAVTDDFEKIVLLDFGVLRPFGEKGLTDGDDILQFVGTLQYSSPEFLLRKEEDSLEGWRALTFYQIGGILHDLIMRKPLFAEFGNPYAALVNAVQLEQPVIQNSEVSQDLVNLAGKCLLKDWRVRLSLLGWSDFEVSTRRVVSQSSAKQRVANRSALLLAETGQNIKRKAAVPRDTQIITAAIEHLKVSVRAIRSENNILPRAHVVRDPPTGNRLVIRYETSPEIGIDGTLQLFILVEVLEALSSAVRLSAAAYIGNEHDAPEINEASELFSGVFNAAGVREALEEFIYLAIEATQKTTAGSEAWLRISI